MMETKLKIGRIPGLVYGDPADRVCLFVHGKGGSKEGAVELAQTACPRGWQVLGVDLPGHGERREEAEAFDPWHAVPDLLLAMEYARSQWPRISLRADSLGAWFSMLAFGEEPLERCLFVSPVLDMERLIRDMMGWASVSEEELRERGEIPTAFGETLSWRYLTYAAEHPITRWNAPTQILYAGGDNLVRRETVETFAKRFGCGLTVMEEGEHWFHTPKQLGVLRRWTEEQMAGGPGA